MAVRFSADGQDYTRASGTFPTMAGPWTVCCWAKITTDRNTYSTIWSLDDGSTANWEYLQTQSDGVTINVDSQAGASIVGPAMTVGAWYFFATVKPSTGVNASTLYYAVETAATLSSATGTLGETTACSTLRIGESPWTSEWLNGCVAAFKLYTAALTAEEVAQERWFFTPQRTANLLAWHPFVSGGAVAEAQTDYSGNGNTLTGGTSSTTEAGPSIAWRPARRRRTYIPASGPPPTGPRVNSLFLAGIGR